jgi:hypothetical protein
MYLPKVSNKGGMISGRKSGNLKKCSFGGREMKKVILIIAVALLAIVGTTWAQEGIEQLERSVDALQETLRTLADGQQKREADLENRKALVLRLRYQMELVSRLTDDQFISIIQELGGDISTSRIGYISALPILEWSIMANITESAKEISVNMKIEEFILLMERQLGID